MNNLEGSANQQMMLEKLADNLRTEREKLGITQTQLAEMLGVTPQAVSKWENARSYPDIETLVRLAELFSMTVDRMLGREDSEE